MVIYNQYKINKNYINGKNAINYIMSSCIFTNDNNVEILLPNHKFSNEFRYRDNHEVMFRRLNTYLIQNKIIKNNIIDLGAWIGDNSIPWAKYIDGVVYSIDPSYENCEFIKEMYLLNNLDNIIVINSAISNKNELLTTNDDINHCSFIYGNPGLIGKNKVSAVSLDYLFESDAIVNVGYIHLDVEGMEYKILEGSTNLIDTCRPIISFEQHLQIDDYDIIQKYLENKNYKVFLIDEILPGCRDDCRNSIAFPNEIYNKELIKNIHEYIGKEILFYHNKI